MEAVLLYEGRISNQRLREHFGVQQVQASRMLAEIRESHPTTVKPAGNGDRGTWIAGPKFKPAVFEGGFNAYMEMAGRSVAVVEDAHRDLTDVDAELHRALHTAATAGNGVLVIYHSMTRPEGVERTIYPHAFVRGGRRWHVRAFDVLRGEHRNFNLGRMLLAHDGEPAVAEVPEDVDWSESADLRLMAHPGLTSGQEQVIRNELFRGTAGRIIRCRRALIPFVLQDLRVATHIDAHQPPDYQLVLMNADDLAPWATFGST
nr:WYL domain-containing protein [Oceanococcus sp. HetDA_MAG_MS8]